MHLFHLTDLILQLVYLLLCLAFIHWRGLLGLQRLDLPDDVFGLLVMGVGTGHSPHERKDQGDKTHHCGLFLPCLVDSCLELFFGLIKQLEKLQVLGL